MTTELLQFIQELSKRDTKNLVEKTLKTTEEVGELAKAVLPYQNASGTRHRFVTKPQILENAVDVILCALSIAYDLGYTNEDITSMMSNKSKKWSGLLSSEHKGQFPLPFEIHVSVGELTQDEIAPFVSLLKEINVKPIIIELEKNSKLVLTDAMTSSIHYGDNTSAMDYMNYIDHFLKSYGYNVVRKKIETVPWHPAALSHSAKSGYYFESHLRIVTTDDLRDKLDMIAKIHNAHLSRNYFKKLSNEEYIIMMTLRNSNTTSKEFDRDVKELEQWLTIEDFIVDKVEIEYAIYDSNINYDKIWFS